MMANPVNATSAQPPSNAVNRFLLGLAGVGGLLIVVLLMQSWNEAQAAQRGDVQQIVQNLDPACRPILDMRVRDKLIREGRPLTRGEMSRMSSSIKDCAVINDQIEGLKIQ